jgi:hypothetical protein
MEILLLFGLAVLAALLGSAVLSLLALAAGIRRFAQGRRRPKPVDGPPTKLPEGPVVLIVLGFAGLCTVVALCLAIAYVINKDYNSPGQRQVREDRARQETSRKRDYEQAVLRAEREEKRDAVLWAERDERDAALASLRAQLMAFAGAESAYRSANGGFYDKPACLVQPATCIPGYLGAAFLDPGSASLKSKGWSLTFHPGLPAPREATRSPSSLRSYAVMAFPTSAGLKPACIDSRGRVFIKLVDLTSHSDGVCSSAEGGVGAFPRVIYFRYEVGMDGCPEQLGQFVVVNETMGEITTDIRTAVPAPLRFSPNVTLRSQESKYVQVFHTCPAKRETFEVDVLPFMPKDVTPEAEMQSRVRVRFIVDQRR